MKKLTHIAAALANNTLSKRSMSHVKGGTAPETLGNIPEFVSEMMDDEKRRERPGGGDSTN